MPENQRPMVSPYKMFYFVLLLLFAACQASDSVNNYENTDSAHGPRIDKEHAQAPPDTTPPPAPKKRDSASLRVPPPGETDTSKLNIK